MAFHFQDNWHYEKIHIRNFPIFLFLDGEEWGKMGKNGEEFYGEFGSDRVKNSPFPHFSPSVPPRAVKLWNVTKLWHNPRSPRTQNGGTFHGISRDKTVELSMEFPETKPWNFP